MKKFSLLFLFLFISMYSRGQVINQISFSPANPTDTDTIFIYSDFSYNGNCSFGLVSLYDYIVGNTIYVVPTYCGYGDSTVCNSLDTLKMGPYPAGNYFFTVQYHQGSVCPLSGFDATIGQYDTSLVISLSTGINNPTIADASFLIYPNPATSSFLVKNLSSEELTFQMADPLGRMLVGMQVRKTSDGYVIERSGAAAGIYSLLITNERGELMAGKKIIWL